MSLTITYQCPRHLAVHHINGGRNDDHNSILVLQLVYQQPAKVSELCYRRVVGAGDDDNEHNIFCCLTYSSRMVPPVGGALEGFQPAHMLPCNIKHSYYRVNNEPFVGTYMLNSTLAMLQISLFDVSAVLEIFATSWIPRPPLPVARPRRQYMNNIISQISINQHLFARDMYVYVSYLPIYHSAPAVCGTFNGFQTTTWQHSININLPNSHWEFAAPLCSDFGTDQRLDIGFWIVRSQNIAQPALLIEIRI